MGISDRPSTKTLWTSPENVIDARDSPKFLGCPYWTDTYGQPFAIWETDLIGELPIGCGGEKYAIVTVDYFTKWVEAKPLTKVSSAKVINFLIRNMLCRYGVPQKIISDNGLQFDSEECQEHGIVKSFSAIAYPQTNG